MALTLTNIPAIMRSHSWGNGARLMDIWFDRTSAVAPAYGPPETATIRMDTWVLTFPRAKVVYDQLITDRIWANPAGQREVGAMLKRKSLLSAGRTFGNLSLPVQNQDADYVNFRVVSFGATDLDDMSAALGNFTYRVLVAGSVAAGPGGAGFQVTVTEIGVYVRDSYDFNGDQFLGFWDDSDNAVSMVNPLSGTSVSNSDFRAWRTANGKGGDYMVLSDVKRTVLRTPDVFVVR